MNYKLAKFNYIHRLDDGAYIPAVDGNNDYSAYLAWVAAGNTPLPVDPDPPPTQDELDIIAAKNYAKLTALKNMTPDQIVTWVQANVTTLATAKDAIQTLAIGLSILARRL
jgi:hypothetical protein